MYVIMCVSEMCALPEIYNDLRWGWERHKGETYGVKTLAEATERTRGVREKSQVSNRVSDYI